MPRQEEPLYVYNPETDRWSAAEVMPTFRSDFGVAALEDKLYAVGGFIYDNKAKTFSASGLNEEYTPVGYRTLKHSDESRSPTFYQEITDPTEAQAELIPVLLPVIVFSGLIITLRLIASLKRRGPSFDSKTDCVIV